MVGRFREVAEGLARLPASWLTIACPGDRRRRTLRHVDGVNTADEMRRTLGAALCRHGSARMTCGT